MIAYRKPALRAWWSPAWSSRPRDVLRAGLQPCKPSRLAFSAPATCSLPSSSPTRSRIGGEASVCTVRSTWTCRAPTACPSEKLRNLRARTARRLRRALQQAHLKRTLNARKANRIATFAPTSSERLIMAFRPRAQRALYPPDQPLQLHAFCIRQTAKGWRRREQPVARPCHPSRGSWPRSTITKLLRLQTYLRLRHAQARGAEVKRR